MKNKKATKVLLFIFITFFMVYKSISFIESNSDKFEQIEYYNRWHNKVWLTLGDSITNANGYQPIVKNKLNILRVDNKGISGQTMSYQKNGRSTYSISKNIDYKKYDLVTIFIGTNDFRYNKKLGKIIEDDIKQYDEATFIGAYQLLIENILSSNPYIDLVLITPLQRTKDGYDINFTNEAGSKLIDYVNAIKDLGQMYSLPVLDLYSTSGFTNKTMSVYTRDDLHPNEAGFERIAEKIYRFLLNI